MLYDYEAQQEDELSLSKGEVVEVMTADGDWWIGAIGDCVGAFPSNYVVSLEAQAPSEELAARLARRLSQAGFEPGVDGEM